MPRTIVVIGASFAGLGVAQALESRAESVDAEVVLIDKRPYHEFHALLYEVATGAVEGRPEDCEKILASGVSVNLHAYERLLRGRRLTFRCAEVMAIDRLTKRIQLRGGEELAYDALVLAVGAEAAFFGIPGLREHAIPLKTTADALRIRRRVLQMLAEVASDAVRPRTILIGGGGPTGVEFAAELANTLQAFVRRGTLQPGRVLVALVEGSARLLSMFPERLGRSALQRLHAFGVRVCLDALVQRVEFGRVTVVPRHLRTGESRAQLLCGFDGPSCTIDAELVVWTGGIQFSPLPSRAGFCCDEKGRVQVGEDFLVRDTAEVFALGDCAAFLHHRTGKALPPVASVAVRQAPVAADNILRLLNGYPLRRFRPPTLPAIVPLGGKWAGCVYRGRTIMGRIPWMLRLAVDSWYFMTTLGWWRGFRVWWRGARVYVQNDG
ncbi:NAD(P)/FAD-dependent oxidoreductase [Candidatus Uhrbacteria bacterium]|nr:NAD(P)/FAD-dependent oxidoreductase [Candidatus Uhrbacteria bacterium]